MKIAVIDLGTNTFHLLIAKLNNKGFDILHKDKVSVKIGEKGISEGMINPDAYARALKTLEHFETIIDDFGASKTYATATSAIRNASNGALLVKDIYKQSGIEVRIISGQQEAEYIYYGVNQALDLGAQPNLIMDIGGGSIEFIIGTRDEIFWKESFEIGAQRLVDLFHHHDPIDSQSIKELEHFLDQELQQLSTACRKFQPKTLIGSSGTFDTLSDIYIQNQGMDRMPNATEYPMDWDYLHEMIEEILQKTREERMAIPGMIEMRVDMIVVACALLRHITKLSGVEQLRVSAFALKEGILLKTIQQLQGQFDQVS